MLIKSEETTTGYSGKNSCHPPATALTAELCGTDLFSGLPLYIIPISAPDAVEELSISISFLLSAGEVAAPVVKGGRLI